MPVYLCDTVVKLARVLGKVMGGVIRIEPVSQNVIAIREALKVLTLEGRRKRDKGKPATVTSHKLARLTKCDVTR